MRLLETRPARRFFIETWGCQMNELDSQRMAGQLMQQGILPTREPDQADLILLNSCSVRDKAENKVFSRLGEYRRFKRQRPDLLIGLTGCVAQQVGERALDRVPELDFVLGTARVGELSSVLDRRRAGERVVAIGFPEAREYAFDAISREGEFKGMVTIVEGCNKRCTFCIVPHTRGPERSRLLAEILAEVRHLVDYGFREIELLGQTVNHWRDPHEDLDFADLLHAVAEVPGAERIRFITSYPRDFTPRMVAAFAAHENITPYLHLPVQSGSNPVLKRMGRGYSRQDYLELVRQLREARPDVALSSDFIVGFPGETETEFQESLSLIEEVRFSMLFAFRYSPRPHTAAPRIGPPVEAATAERRLQELFEVQHEIQLDLNRALVGRTVEVLVTGWGRDGENLAGRTPCHRIVHFPPGPHRAPPGSLTSVRVTEALPHCLRAVPHPP